MTRSHAFSDIAFRRAYRDFVVEMTFLPPCASSFFTAAPFSSRSAAHSGSVHFAVGSAGVPNTLEMHIAAKFRTSS